MSVLRQADERYAKALCSHLLQGDSLYLYYTDLKDLIVIDPEILRGQPVFKGTRVPVETLFDHLEAGVSLEEF